MEKKSFKQLAKASMSLSSLIQRQKKKLPPTASGMMMGFSNLETQEVVQKKDLLSLLVQSEEVKKLAKEFADLSPEERIEPLSETILSARVTVETARLLVESKNTERVNTKKEKQLHLDAASLDVALTPTSGVGRAVIETGKKVLIGIVDSGFDLTHPMFRDAAGKLRVDGLLDQTGLVPKEFTTAQLETNWAAGTKSGGDDHGHGTHVAGIAGGTKFKGFEGMAPGARFLLVKTNFVDTADGVKWAFTKAGTKPCVVNMSLGSHFGSHDGSSAEEILIDQLSGPGKIVVISAGNEREGRLHVGGRFLANEIQNLTFDVQRSRNPLQNAMGLLTLWYDPSDDFDVTLLTPSNQELPVPAVGTTDSFSTPSVDVEIGRSTYTPTNLIQIQITLSFQSSSPAPALLNDWGLRLNCRTATIGRIDGWFANTGFGRFDPHPFVEETRTIGMPATANACVAVASHVSKRDWKSDAGNQQDLGVVVGRSSPFSSQGPTRDGRLKPDISAPGQFLTSALGSGSDMENEVERVRKIERLLTIEGTSMSAPVVTGLIALLLQKKKTLTPDAIKTILKSSARIDAHVGTAGWNPTYGNGKIDIKKAMSAV